MVKWKLHRGQTQQHYTSRRTPALCKHLHRHHANTRHVIRYGSLTEWYNSTIRLPANSITINSIFAMADLNYVCFFCS